MSQPINIFIAYSHKDKELKDKLKIALGPLVKSTQIKIWDDGKIEPGAEWDKTIKEQLYSADIFLLLISPDSLASEYFDGEEVKTSLKRHIDKKSVVVPVLLRDCDWENESFSKLQFLPTGAKPVKSWGDEDAAFKNIVVGLKITIEARRIYRDELSAFETLKIAFEAAYKTAMQFAKEQHWAYAISSFEEAKGLHESGFEPEKSAVAQLILDCRKEIAKEKKAHQLEIDDVLSKDEAFQKLKIEAQNAQKAQKNAESDLAALSKKLLESEAKLTNQSRSTKSAEQEIQLLKTKRDALEADQKMLENEVAQFSKTMAEASQKLAEQTNQKTAAAGRAADFEQKWKTEKTDHETSAFQIINLSDHEARLDFFIKKWPTSPFSTSILSERARQKAVAERAAEAQKVNRDDPFHDQMISVAGGSFQMGSNKYDSEKPIHRVDISPFWMQKTPVTQAQYQKIMGQDPSNFKGENLPVETVNWDDAQLFLKKLNEKTGLKYRLPSEAEWEFAARGGTKTNGFEFAGSNDLKEVGWFRENSGSKTNPVAGLDANELGLFDMSGNVWEWCEDLWHDNYSGAPSNGSAWTSGGNNGLRVVRGGWWYINPFNCRAANRVWDNSDNRNYYCGFRLARN